MTTSAAIHKQQLFLALDQRSDLANRNGREIEIEPIDATFRDSARAPLHSWFPYLEGYSPRFVNGVRSEFLPNSKKIIDPFAGSGTTPIVLGQAGVECAYSEANPAMAFVIETKLSALRLSMDERKLLSNGMRKLARQLTGQNSDCKPDDQLAATYTASFGRSIFFSDETFIAFRQLRTLNDELNATNPMLGRCLTLAVLSALIPCSYLKRAGDLRFKTRKEVLAGLPEPLDAVSARLKVQAADLLASDELQAPTTFASSTAVDLIKSLDGSWDGVITSPPYLNGTNYIRNSRLELWYLRSIRKQSDLRLLRDGVITSGINDVDYQTPWSPVTQGVESVVAELQEKAYDVRIAKMVGGYFYDMNAVLVTLKDCTHGGARICIDIGDSIYAGVHVRTDDLLVEVAEALGFQTRERIDLRKRKSKCGDAVRQQLLVFEKPTSLLRKPSVKPIEDIARTAKIEDGASRADLTLMTWPSKWATFKRSLPHQIAPYSKREWGGPAHSMCSYQGKIKPALAHHLIESFSSPGDVVVDPFSGAATIPFEACRMGRNGFGIDISELGYVLTLAKVGATSATVVATQLAELDAYIRSYKLSKDDTLRASEVRFNSAIPDYFHPETLREVVAAREFFKLNWGKNAEWALLFASTLHLLHGNRPYALSRNSHPVTPFAPTGPFEHRELLPRLREKLARMNEDLRVLSRAYGEAVQADCTQPWPSAVPKANTIITSPPFFDSTRFYMTNWMRFWFVGWERSDFDTRTENYVENKQKRSLDIYKSFFAAARAGLKDNGLLVLHLGQSKKCDMGIELAKRVDPWFTVEDCFTEGVEHCESHGVRDKGTVSGHTYLVLSTK